jgi:hypothetical protein
MDDWMRALDHWQPLTGRYATTGTVKLGDPRYIDDLMTEN